MRVLTDENVKSTHVSALDAAGHDVVRVVDVVEPGASDSDILATARTADRVVLTYDRKDFGEVSGHAGVLIAIETMTPRAVRQAVERLEHVYPDLYDVVEYLSDWT